MLNRTFYGERSSDRRLVFGCDFGVPRRWEDQRKKIILVEAERIDERHYRVTTSGRNQRLVDWALGSSKGPGWSLSELIESLQDSRDIRVGALDFPFSIPESLLMSNAFSGAVGCSEVFHDRASWARWVADHLVLDAHGQLSSRSRWTDFSAFDGWRVDSKFWLLRETDQVAKALPPLKHVGQVTFNMTLGGVLLLEKIRQHVQLVAIDSLAVDQEIATLFETYPKCIAQHLGFQASYKKEPVDCMSVCLRALESRRVKLDIDVEVMRFCESYRSGSKRDDADGVDALLCLLSAICFDVGDYVVLRGNASDEQLSKEGAILVPRNDAGRQNNRA